jgi:hypothetical protein
MRHHALVDAPGDGVVHNRDGAGAGLLRWRYGESLIGGKVPRSRVGRAGFAEHGVLDNDHDRRRAARVILPE